MAADSTYLDRSSLEYRARYFWSKVSITDSCWVWQAALNTDGYGSFWNGKTVVGAHTFSWKLHQLPLRTGQELDHLCENKACVNPEHLEAVTHRENSKRIYVRKPRLFCFKGHELTGKNVKTRANGNKKCVICERRLQREYKRKVRGTLVENFKVTDE